MDRTGLLRPHAVALVLTAALLPSHAQSPSADPARLKAGAASASAVDPADGLNRIIIGWRPDQVQAASAGSATARRDPAERVRALGRERRLTTDAGEAVELSYRRSVSDRTHVAMTHRRMNRAEMTGLLRQLRQDAQIAYVEIDERVTAQFMPNDTEFLAQQWSMQSLAAGAGAGNFPGAWDRATGAGVIVAQLDGGFRPHADLFANVLPGYDFISADPSGRFDTANDGDGRDSDARDPGDWSDRGDCPPGNSGWHGTHVAGVIAAVGNNNSGVAGAAFGARLLPIRVLGVCGGYVSDIAAGMRWAVGLPVPGVPANNQVAKVLNMSLGRFGSCSQAFQGAVDEVLAAGSVVVAATGNDSARAILQPANCTGVIGVTAHAINGDNASYANIGQGTVISAPGGGFGAAIAGNGRQIYSTSNTGLTTPQADRLEFKRGTSMATAHVSGVAALMFEAKPTITPQELRSRLVNAARPHPAGGFCAGLQTCGAGLLDAAQSVQDVLDDNAPVVAAASSAGLAAPRGATVQLTGTALAGRLGMGLQSTSWTQIAGPAVTLTGANGSNASFVVPASGNSFSFRFRALDLNGKAAHVDLTVPANNTAPVLTPISTRFVLEGESLSFSVSATDAEGDAITFVASTLPRGASFDAGTGTFTWDNASPLGSYSVGITPSDGLLSGETVYVGIVVVAPGSGGGGATQGLWWVLLGSATLAGLGLRRLWRLGARRRAGMPRAGNRPATPA
ncbi:MAG: S8 family serine peptidase [Burkholderiaceae bacterium]